MTPGGDVPQRSRPLRGLSCTATGPGGMFRVSGWAFHGNSAWECQAWEMKPALAKFNPDNFGMQLPLILAGELREFCGRM